MHYAYGETAAEEIMSENEGDFLSWEEQARRIGRAQTRFDEMKACINALPAYDKITNAMKTLEAPMTPDECGIDIPAIIQEARGLSNPEVIVISSKQAKPPAFIKNGRQEPLCSCD